MTDGFVAEPVTRRMMLDLLEPEETVIDVHYMQQLLAHGMQQGMNLLKTAQAQGMEDIAEEDLRREAEVCFSMTIFSKLNLDVYQNLTRELRALYEDALEAPGQHEVNPGTFTEGAYS
jgi:hypothetical protein